MIEGSVEGDTEPGFDVKIISGHYSNEQVTALLPYGYYGVKD